MTVTSIINAPSHTRNKTLKQTNLKVLTESDVYFSSFNICTNLAATARPLQPPGKSESDIRSRSVVNRHSSSPMVSPAKVNGRWHLSSLGRSGPLLNRRRHGGMPHISLRCGHRTRLPERRLEAVPYELGELGAPL